MSLKKYMINHIKQLNISCKITRRGKKRVTCGSILQILRVRLYILLKGLKIYCFGMRTKIYNN